MMQRYFDLIQEVLRERYDRPWCVSFKMDWSTQDQTWGAEALVSKAEGTCAAVLFKGSGESMESAVEDLVRKVALDRAERSEIG